MDSLASWVPTIVGSIIASGAAYLLVNASREKLKAEAEKLRSEAAATLTTSATNILAEYKDQVEQLKSTVSKQGEHIAKLEAKGEKQALEILVLENKVSTMQRYKQALENWARALSQQVLELRGDPVPLNHFWDDPK